jgi:hypothetical protein
MKDYVELIKSLVRPFIIFWGFIIYGVCIMTGREIPTLLAGLITAIVVEYFSERAIIRLKENGTKRDSAG